MNVPCPPLHSRLMELIDYVPLQRGPGMIYGFLLARVTSFLLLRAVGGVANGFHHLPKEGGLQR